MDHGPSRLPTLWFSNLRELIWGHVPPKHDCYLPGATDYGYAVQCNAV